MTLQHVTRNKFHLRNVFAVRVGTSIQEIAKSTYTEADGCTLVYYTNDKHPDFHYYETNHIANDVSKITHNRRTRALPFLTSNKRDLRLDNADEPQ